MFPIRDFRGQVVAFGGRLVGPGTKVPEFTRDSYLLAKAACFMPWTRLVPALSGKM